MTRCLPVLLLMASGCIDFDRIELEACTQRGVCDPDAGSTGLDASVAYFCQACTQHTQCGGGGENRCVSISAGPGFCGVDCSNTLCGAGQSCQALTGKDGGFLARNCVPVSGRCDGG